MELVLAGEFRPADTDLRKKNIRRGSSICLHKAWTHQTADKAADFADKAEMLI